VDFRQPFGRDENVHILGEAAIPVQEQGHAAGDGVRDAELLQPRGDLSQRLMNRTLLFEVHAPLAQGPIDGPPQTLLVANRWCSHTRPFYVARRPEGYYFGRRRLL